MSVPTFPFEYNPQVYNATQNKTQLTVTETAVLGVLHVNSLNTRDRVH